MARTIKRREFLKAASVAAAAAVMPRVGRAEDGKKLPRPNIVFINMDDLGWKDVAFMGSKFYETPHLDKLASEGMVFTNAYSNAANCAPSRACVMSGQYGPRHGVYTVGSSERGNAKAR